jgi:hypothetical protein
LTDAGNAETNEKRASFGIRQAVPPNVAGFPDSLSAETTGNADEWESTWEPSRPAK